MFIWKPHPGKLNEMREMVMVIRDHCRRIGGTGETEKALEGFRADETFMGVMADAYKVR